MKNMQHLSFISAKRALTPIVIGLSATFLLTTSVSAQTPTPSDFTVTSSSTPAIKSGVRSFKKGDYDLAVTYNIKALDGGLSPRRKAIAYNNLCAAYGARGNYDKAQEACSAALTLDASFAEAQQNTTLVKRALNGSR